MVKKMKTIEFEMSGKEQVFFLLDRIHKNYTFNDVNMMKLGLCLKDLDILRDILVKQGAWYDR